MISQVCPQVRVFTKILRGERAASSPSLHFCIFCFLAAMMGVWVGGSWIVYAVGLGWSVFRALRRPAEGLWLLFFNLTVTVISVPLEYTGEFTQEAPKAYLYWGLSIACVGSAIWLGSFLKPRRFQDERRNGIRGLFFFLFLSVVLLSSVYGYAQGNSSRIIIRQGSGLVFLFFFILIGHRVRLSVRELSKSVEDIETVLVAYACVYLVQEVYINTMLRFALPDGDFFRERSPVLFFCALFAALELGRWIIKGVYQLPDNWFRVSLLLASAILSGSRSAIISMLFVVLLVVVLRYAARPLRACLCLTLILLGSYWLNSQGFLSQMGIRSPFLQHIADRYMVSLEQDLSFLERTSQMNAVWEGLKSKPLLGNGVGASLVWFDPYNRAYVETSFVDSGIGYLLLKMGSLGLCTFLLFIVPLFRQVWIYWKSTHHEVFLLILMMLSFYSAYLPFGPSFFQFITSFWVGILIGHLFMLNKRSQTVTWPAAPYFRVQSAP